MACGRIFLRFSCLKTYRAAAHPFLYQTLSPPFAAEFFSFETAEVETLERYYAHIELLACEEYRVRAVLRGQGRLHSNARSRRSENHLAPRAAAAATAPEPCSIGSPASRHC
jgi:hypothetical protein